MSSERDAFHAPDLPHRITFLAPKLTLSESDAALERFSAIVLAVTLFEHLLRHPTVTMTDPDDFRLTDPDDRLLTAEHPEIEALKQTEFADGRRDELLWFELSLDPSRSSPVRLHVERWDGERRSFSASASTPLSKAIEHCLSEWLGSIRRAQPPRPLEAFEASDVVEASRRLLRAVEQCASNQDVDLDPPAKLRIPFLRAVYVTCNLYTFTRILEIEPDNPWAIRDQFLHGIHNGGPTTRDPIRRAIQTAPMFGKLYLSMFGDGVSDDEKVRSFAMASILIPGNAFALKDYGYALNGAQRWAEALRYGARAARRAPWMLDTHLLLLEVVDLCRYGRGVIDSTRRLALLEELAQNDIVRENDPDYLHCQLRHSSWLMRSGRLEEAIALRAELLEGRESAWPNQTKLLTDWRTDPALFAQLYAREAFLRGDPGRVVDGFAAAAPDSGSEVAMLIEAFLALGDDDLALVAFAHRSKTNLVQNPIARLAGAKALLANGELARAIDCIHGSALRFPTAGWDTAHNRLLRVASSRPLAEWEAVVDHQLADGAKRLAWLVARDAADFVPKIPKTSSIAKVLTAPTKTPFDNQRLTALRALVGSVGLEAIDAFFAKSIEPSLENADRLANEWPKLIPTLASEPTKDEVHTRAAKLLFVFAHAFGRYLCLTTDTPNVLSGGYRQVASDALEMMRSVRGVLERNEIRAFLQGIEPIAPHVDVWMLDTWLLRFERALDIEAREGHLAVLADGFPTVRSLLRGDEQVAYEHALAYRAQGREALALLERSVRAIGRGPAPKWSEIAVATLPPAERLDLHLTAAFIANNYAGPSVEAAKVLLQSGGEARAFEELCTSFAQGGKQWREKQAAGLKPLWEAAKMPCAIDWQPCFDAGMKAFQQGKMQLALDSHRWLAAYDPGNDQLSKNLGMAYGFMGKPIDCIGAFACASVAEAPKWAGQLLRQAGDLPGSTRAYRYASLWFTTGDEWSYLAVSANLANDYETSAHAYERAFELKPELATMSHLNTYADALYETGNHKALSRVADDLAKVAGADPIYGANAAFHKACALVGMGRFAEAVPFAKDAAQRNTLPDNAKLFAEVLEQAEKRIAPAPKALPGEAPHRRASRRLAQGEFREVAAQGPSEADWKLARISLAANRFRFESENDAGVTPRHLEASLDVLERSAGSTDVDASLCRLEALFARENALFPVDPPCPLGTRIPREEFGRIFAQKSGRSGAAAEAASAAAAQAAKLGGDADPEVFPGQPLPRLSDYARIMKGAQSGKLMAVLKAEGLDMATYGQVGARWGKKLAEDAALAAKFQTIMTAR